MAWKNLRVRADLHRLVADRAKVEQRSVSQMGDVLLTRALEQTPGAPPGEREPSRLTAAPVSARASDAHEVPAGPQPPPPSDVSSSASQGREDEAGVNGGGVRGQLEGQTDIYEMLGACPECAGAMEKVGDDPEHCVECGYARES